MDYFKADQPILDLVAKTAADYHARLDGANIAVIMRERAAHKGGKVIIATASLVSAKLKPLLADQDVQFVIAVADNEWPELTEAQRAAVIDHELCHCTFTDSGKPKIRAHDMECFAEVIERHGMWRPDETDRKVQAALIPQGVKVGTVTGLPEAPAGEGRGGRQIHKPQPFETKGAK